MKKTLLTAATLLVMFSSGAFAQGYGNNYPRPNTYPNQLQNYPNQQPGYNQGYGQSQYDQQGYNQPGYNYDYNDSQFDRHLDWWDRELNLSRRQEREIRRVRDRFNQQVQGINPRDPRQRDAFRQLRQREFIDMMALLSPPQRDQVISRMRPYERVADRGAYGRDPRGGNGANRGSGYGPYGY